MAQALPPGCIGCIGGAVLLSSCAYQGKRGCLSEATLLSQRRGGRQQACPFAPQTGKRSDAPSACLWEEVTIHPIPFSGAESMKYRNPK